MTRLLMLAAVSATVVIAGCGGGSKDSSTQSSSGESGSAYVDQVRKEVDVLLSEKGTYGEPPKTAPKPESGKKIALISCGQNVTFCSSSMAGAESAAEALGWQTTLYDTKAEPANAATGIRQAIVGGADGIFIHYVDCTYIKSALEEAKEANVPVVTAESFDCNQTGKDPAGAPTTVAGQVTFKGDMTYGEYIAEWQQAQGKYAIAQLDGNANMLFFADDVSIGSEVEVTAMEELAAECSTCSLQVIEFPYADLEKGLEGTAANALLKNPDSNAVIVGYEAMALAGVQTAVAASGKDIVFTDGEGGEAGVELVREGKASAGAGLPIRWEGWAGLDCLNRIFNGEECVESGIGQQLFDAEHNLPASGRYVTPVDFEAGYEKAWGL